ncbi:Uncharacterised protein [Candidatus Tiddalikarchaeum anstoanum]|nr:Uncharacterised protein [Candidatus Tiddalikarchaeum anstoanum]
MKFNYEKNDNTVYFAKAKTEKPDIYAFIPLANYYSVKDSINIPLIPADMEEKRRSCYPGWVEIQGKPYVVKVKGVGCRHKKTDFLNFIPKKSIDIIPGDYASLIAATIRWCKDKQPDVFKRIYGGLDTNNEVSAYGDGKELGIPVPKVLACLDMNDSWMIDSYHKLAPIISNSTIKSMSPLYQLQLLFKGKFRCDIDRLVIKKDKDEVKESIIDFASKVLDGVIKSVTPEGGCYEYFSLDDFVLTQGPRTFSHHHPLEHIQATYDENNTYFTLFDGEGWGFEVVEKDELPLKLLSQLSGTFSGAKYFFSRAETLFDEDDKSFIPEFAREVKDNSEFIDDVVVHNMGDYDLVVYSVKKGNLEFELPLLPNHSVSCDFADHSINYKRLVCDLGEKMPHLLPNNFGGKDIKNI